MVVNNGKMQDGPSSGHPLLGKEAPGVLAGWARLQVPFGWEGKEGESGLLNFLIDAEHMGCVLSCKTAPKCRL